MIAASSRAAGETRFKVRRMVLAGDTNLGLSVLYWELWDEPPPIHSPLSLCSVLLKQQAKFTDSSAGKCGADGDYSLSKHSPTHHVR